MKYFIIGYMGSGKTHMGELLAQKHQLKFIDLDQYIAQQENKTISELFHERGETTFRTLENNYLRHLCQQSDNFVLATGGGAPCHDNNIQYMNTQGHTIFLNTSEQTLIRRLINDKTHRPLISHMTEEQIRTFVPRHLRERLAFYQQAKETITTP